jgi:Arylsulfotransferase (ASST)
MPCSPLSTRVLVLLPLLSLPSACSDDGLAENDSDGGSTGSAESSVGTTLTTGPSTGTQDPSSTDATSPDSSDGESADTTGADAIDVSAEVTLYDAQPMVADLELTLSAPGTATVTHTTDAGVVIAPLDGGDDTHLRFRVRGLAPDLDHTLAYQVTGGSGGAADDEVAFTTPAALPGFIAAFELETTDIEPEPLYRMIDLNVFPIGDTNGLAMVDTAGITRWYLGGENTLAGPPSVWAAPKVRADGTVMYLRGDTLWIRDELANVMLELPGLDIGLPSLHHDAVELDNGNILTMSLAFQEVDYGPDGVLNVAGDLLVELTPDGEIVWSWNSFDHLDPQRRRADFDALYHDPINNEDGQDWTHGNGIIYDPDADTVLLSMRHQDWIILIDRASGDVLWTLGDEGDFDLPDDDRWFFHQHSPQWQPDGSLLLYDNGVGNPYIEAEAVESHATRLEIDFDAMTADVVWRDDEAPFVSVFAGDADLLPGGHYLVADAIYVDGPASHGRLRELDPAHDPTRVWSIRMPDNYFIYRSTAHEQLIGLATR